MALPNTNISVAMVRDELGAATNDVGQLCIHPNVNKWSRFRPGYWYCPSNLADITFVIPDGVSVDHRSPLDTIRGKMAYHLGDFRGYNHNANAMELASPGTSEIPFNPTATSVDLSYSFYSGDPDWRGEETQVNGVNRINPNGGTSTLFILKEGNTVLGSRTIPTTNTLLTISFSVPVSGVSKTVSVALYAGDEAHTAGFAKFPFMSKSFHLTPLSYPLFGLALTPTLFDQIRASFEAQTGLVATTVYIYPNNKQLVAGTTSVVVDDFSIVVYTSNSQYDAIPIHGSIITADIEYKDANGNYTYEYNKSYTYHIGLGGLGTIGTVTFNNSIDYGETVTLRVKAIDGDLIFSER